jgi:serine/threonine protein kinase/Tol biopolymer transport system component
MTITTGTRLGPYEILEPLGAGGMGEVFKARDTRLDRSVAIKVLAPAFAQNEQLKLRFEREARTISQLTHPHICTLYDVGNDQGLEYLVMELLEGETLADRVARGPLPMRDVLRFGREIAEALDRAHRAGVVHRDLKPANVMITKSGARLLDFGLARSGAVSFASGGVSAEDGATQHKSLTQEGTIVGTFQYMAPEQLEGADADARTDIFALGALLYELATGRRAFDGKTKTSLIAAIVGSDPTPIRDLQPLTPPAFEHVVAKCLAKDPDQRWQSASDIASELAWIGSMSSQSQAIAGVPRRRSRARAAWATTAALLLIGMATASMFLLRPRAAQPPLRLSLTMPPHANFDGFTQAAFSPDGSSIVFVGHVAVPPGSPQSLWIRPLDRSEVRQLPGTQGALEPFWSPDGKSVGFFAQGKLKRVAIAGGAPQVICDAAGAFGGTWNRDGVILFCSDTFGPLVRVDAAGGTPKPLTRLTPREEAHRWPVFLPDGDHFIFMGDASHTEDHHLKVGTLHDGSSRDLLQGVTNALYVAPGELLYVRAGSLLAQPFDVRQLRLTGEPRVIAEQVSQNDGNHHFEFAASSNGQLIYRAGSPDAQLTWVDRSGHPLGTAGDARNMDNFHLSPDGKRVVFDQNDADGRPDDIWIQDARNVVSRFTFDPSGDFGSVWSPDGLKVAFSSMRGAGIANLFVADVVNPSAARRLTSYPVDQVIATSWTHDSSMIIADHLGKTDTDIWIYPAAGGAGKPYLATPFVETQAVLSPDDSFIAYMSTESGRPEVYVERFPSHAGRRQISQAGGSQPQWSSDGKELYFVTLGYDLTSIEMTSEAAVPKTLFHLPGNHYAATADGQRLLVDRPADDNFASPLTFVSNWRAEPVSR